MVYVIWMLKKQLMIGGTPCEKVTASILVYIVNRKNDLKNGEETRCRLGRIILPSVN